MDRPNIPIGHAPLIAGLETRSSDLARWDRQWEVLIVVLDNAHHTVRRLALQHGSGVFSVTTDADLADPDIAIAHNPVMAVSVWV